MNYIFYFLIVFSLIFGAINGRLDNVVNAIISGANLSVKIAFSLIGIMTFWLGIMHIAEKSGLVKILARLIKPLTNWLFDEISPDNPAMGNIAMSFSANALGLTNAATPIGLKVMQELQDENQDKTTASNAMCMFLAMNTAGFQIIPAAVIAILAGAGAENPTEIIIPAMIVTAISFVSSVLIAKLFQKFWHPQTINNGGSEEL
ncbi:MAG: hypothetical protein LUB59_04805 [Candidatus Gastranaerophilales bacterium]|nr:hypothetical protein [Candidatus Gastranaerophilales bacterium]